MRTFLVVLILLFVAGIGAQSIGPGAAIPAVAYLPGVGATFWQSDVVIHNPNDSPTTVSLLLFPEIKDGETTPEIKTEEDTVPARGQLTLSNVVGTVFHQPPNTKGALSVSSTNGASLVVGSRTYTFGDDGGSFGQDVFGILVTDRGWASGVREDSFYRTNVGIFLPVPPAQGQTVAFSIIVRDPDGEEVASGSIDFGAAGLRQRPLSDFVVSQLFSGSIEVICSDPSYFWYGYISRIDNISGDAVYRPLRGKEF